MGNEIALIVPLIAFVSLFILFFLLEKFTSANQKNRIIHLIIFFVFPISLLIIFFMSPYTFFNFFYSLLSESDFTATQKIFFIFFSSLFVYYLIIIYYNLFLLLFRRISWKKYKEDPFMKMPRTHQIIFDAISNFQENFSNYILLALPAIIANSIHTIVFINFDLGIITYSSLILVYYFDVITIVNIHRYVILKENISLKFIFRNYSVYLKYFGYGTVLFAIGLGPSIGSIFAIPELRENMDMYSLTQGYFLLISLVMVIVSAFFIFMTYPLLAFIFPMVSTNERINIKKILKSTKGYRLTILLQFIFIFLFFEILVRILEFFLDTNSLFDENLFIVLLLELYYVIPFIITIIALSLTYVSYKKNSEAS